MLNFPDFDAVIDYLIKGGASPYIEIPEADIDGSAYIEKSGTKTVNGKYKCLSKYSWARQNNTESLNAADGMNLGGDFSNEV